jgi:hypothetical protein
MLQIFEMTQIKSKTIICPECAGDINIGIAIQPYEEYTARPSCWYTPDILNHKTLQIIEVFKCEHCGYSYTED